jgi:hypothetical protein
MVVTVLSTAPVVWAWSSDKAPVSTAKAVGAQEISQQEKSQLQHRQAVAAEQKDLLAGADNRNMIMDDEESIYVYGFIVLGITAGLLVCFI